MVYGASRGTLKPGKIADLVVWSGDPFELATRAERVVIAGVEQPLRSREVELRDRYRALVPARRREMPASAGSGVSASKR